LIFKGVIAALNAAAVVEESEKTEKETTEIVDEEDQTRVS